MPDFPVRLAGEPTLALGLWVVRRFSGGRRISAAASAGSAHCRLD